MRGSEGADLRGRPRARAPATGSASRCPSAAAARTGARRQLPRIFLLAASSALSLSNQNLIGSLRSPAGRRKPRRPTGLSERPGPPHRRAGTRCGSRRKAGGFGAAAEVRPGALLSPPRVTSSERRARRAERRSSVAGEPSAPARVQTEERGGTRRELPSRGLVQFHRAGMI